MRKKTIGEVLRLARINQGMSLEDLQKKTDIQLELLEAMEADDFDRLPSPFYARSFLRKYAWTVDLDERIILDAYEEGSMITYDEVDVDEEENFRSRRTKKQRTSFLPLFYLTILALAILSFVSYYVWTYIHHNSLTTTPSLSYSVVNKQTTTSSSSTNEATSSESSRSPNTNLTVSGNGNNLTATLTGATSSVNLKLSVTDATSWVSVTGTDLEGGAILSPENQSVSTTISPGTTSTITLGVVQGVTITIDNQQIDTSGLTSLTGTITLIINN